MAYRRSMFDDPSMLAGEEWDGYRWWEHAADDAAEVVLPGGVRHRVRIVDATVTDGRLELTLEPAATA